MRVVECPACGETLSAADDTELADRLHRHMGETHGAQLDAQPYVEANAYDAMDS